MELCDCNLESLCRMKELRVSERFQLLEQAAAGCAYIVHKEGVHGNLKMDNLLIKTSSDDGKMQPVVKVADFELGRALCGSTPEVQLAHMTPESERFSEKCDVY
eukprot:5740994-Amphidinium_carterae.1